MTSPIRTLIISGALALLSPLSAANSDGLQVHVESVSLVPLLQPEELGRALAEVESEYVSYSGYAIIPLRDRAPSLNPSDRAAVEQFENDLIAAIANFDGRDYQPYSSPQQFAELVADMEALRMDGDPPIDQDLIGALRRIESNYSGISGFALINLAGRGQQLLDGTTPSARDNTSPKGGYGDDSDDNARVPEVDPSAVRAFWSDYDEALAQYRRSVPDQTQVPDEPNPYVTMTIALQDIHNRFFSSSGSNDQLTVTLVIENHGQRPATVRQRARMRILGDAGMDVGLSINGAASLQSFEVSTITFTSVPLMEMDSRDAAAIRDAIAEDGEAVVAIQDAGGQAFTARTRLGGGDAGMDDDALEDALDAALGG